MCCLMSPYSIKQKKFIEFWLAALLNKCIEENQLKIVILLKDIDSSYIPNFIRWVTYIDITNEPSSEERIYDIIKGTSSLCKNLQFRKLSVAENSQLILILIGLPPIC